MLAVPLLAALLAGAAPAAAVDVVVAPEIVRPGDVVLVRIARPAEAPAPTATLAGRPLQFWVHGGERWAVAALPLETPPGPVLLEVAGDGAEPPRSAIVSVVEPGFPSRTLHVAPRFVKPPASMKARIARDQRAIAAAYARPFAPPLFGSSFAWPRTERTNGRFGDQRVFNGKKESVHYGLDIDAPRGSPVHASNDGEVVLARSCYYSGNTVMIWHGADVFTLYFHLDRIEVRAGERVAKGGRLGVVGSTGRSTGPHLHWSARAAGLLVDPESLLGIDFVTGAAPPRRAGPPPHREEPAVAATPETISPAEAATSITPAGTSAPAPPR